MPRRGLGTRLVTTSIFSPIMQFLRQDSQSSGSSQSKQKCEAGVGEGGPTRKMLGASQVAYFSDANKAKSFDVQHTCSN